MTRPMLFDGLESAFIGYAQQANGDALAVYDWDKMIEHIIESEGVDIADAIEYLEFNTACAFVGKGTPLILRRCDLSEMNDLFGTERS